MRMSLVAAASLLGLAMADDPQYWFSYYTNEGLDCNGADGFGTLRNVEPGNTYECVDIGKTVYSVEIHENDIGCHVSLFSEEGCGGAIELFAQDLGCTRDQFGAKSARISC